MKLKYVKICENKQKYNIDENKKEKAIIKYININQN